MKKNTAPVSSREAGAYTYILECSDGTLYTGYTVDLIKRLNAHNTGRGSKYTRCRLPVRLVYYEVFATKREAMRREYAIKKLPRKKKMDMIATFSK
ncbi:MAG: GIY-YIG nuclease family protein [Anaerovibrio sp.]